MCFMREHVVFSETWKKDSANTGLSMHMTSYGNKNAKTYISVPPDPQNGLVAGTKFWPVWEVMLNREHEHPHFRAPRLGCFSNQTLDYNAANRLGFKVIWESNGQWYFKYIQRSIKHLREPISTDPGSSHTYTLGACLYSYFTRITWGQAGRDAPGFYVDFGKAEILDLKIDHFRQEYTLTLDTSQPAYKGPIAPSTQGAATQMEQLGLENIDEEWQQFTPHNNDAVIRGHKLPQTDIARYVNTSTMTPKDTRCDSCFELNVSSIS